MAFLLRKKIEKIQEQALRILYNNFSSNFEFILNKSGKSTMEAKRLRTLAQEVFKTLNMNPEYMKEIFDKTAFMTHTTKYRSKSLRCPGPHIWNSLLNQIKKETNNTKFKGFIND